ncbi:ABC transporter substrate-binding protein [Mesorhizobium sp. M1A.T.Ca.IN.004.03.1.1]|uniref:ABC transporter substrate-binding protein n=1 Tax=Mesorhizobium sp. M1A.T.Ca.IN.004.03.1.1 TaxID=2496795 RepID=UPI000FCAE63F|nr:ABC transporter substrate-binding protein [Mesorhizobium sp. M1A.T.Ca.IN.004.03.1.1]RUV40488.1 ABC transporter substrate-binding protein [Mesorhizobium sp. M1A.T.Ca.IN.004.03.1.1]
MRISRREMIKAGLAAGAAISIPSVLRAQTAAADARTVRMMLGNLSVFDPMLTTAVDTVTHGLAIYDTLFAYDSKYLAQPQMVGKWSVSDDKKIYTFELRDGLGWHDGSDVTAADCVASIRRWGQVNPGGQMVISRTKNISKKDGKTFTIELKEPVGLLLDLLASQIGPAPFMMREKDADRPATEQVTANIGSGPFKFNQELAKPGASFTYDRNEKYVPREEISDGLAGGKVVKVDRVIWDIITDEQTAFAALQSGEIDYIQVPSPDLYSAIASDPDLELTPPKSNEVYFMRMNCLQKPFENVKARQAMLYLVDQEAFMRTSFPPEYTRTITSFFGNNTFYSNDENTGWFKKGGDPEKAKQLFKEAGYAGEKVVILQRTDWAAAGNMAQLLAATLRKIGVNAELAPGDGSASRARAANRGSVENGGWSIFITSESDFSRTDPVGNPTLSANGENGWTGWPKNDEYEALRAKWADVDRAERKALASKMQQLQWDFVGTVFLGEAVSPTASRKALTGLIPFPDCTPLWNMQKASN